MLNRKFFHILLDANQNTVENPPVENPPEKKEDEKPEDNSADLESLKASVEKLERALEAERLLKREADQKAKEAAKAAEDAGKTAEQKLAERLDLLETENSSLKLETKKARAVRDELAALDSDGYTVDAETLEGLLSVAQINLENVETVVKTVIGGIKKVKSTQTQTKNSQPPAGQAPKYEFGKLPDDALVAPLSKQPEHVKI